jgi:hypothetical protein
VFFSAWVTFVRVFSGLEPFTEVGLSYKAIITTYFILGLVGGSILGVLRRFTYAWLGAAFVGWFIAFVVYAGVSVALGNPPWRWPAFMWILMGIASCFVGGVGGLTHWWRHVRSEQPPERLPSRRRRYNVR